MRLLLKILAAPLIVALALLVWICSGLLYCTAFTPPHHLELHLTGLHPQIPQLLGQYPRRASVE